MGLRDGLPVYSYPTVCGAAQLMLHSTAICLHATSHASAQVPAYRLKLPPKRIFLHIQTPEFVEERRQQLDQYLQALLGAGNLANMPQVGTCCVPLVCCWPWASYCRWPGVHWATQCQSRQG